MRFVVASLVLGLMTLGVTAVRAEEMRMDTNPTAIEAVGSYTNPVSGGIPMGDPFVLLHEGRYTLYGTTAGDGFLCWTSTDLANWPSLGYAFRRTETSWGTGTFWAPEVIRYRDRFYMVYSSLGRDVQGYRICLAVSDRPEGPFTDVAAPLFDPGHACIDGHIFIDEDGTPYLFYDKVGQEIDGIMQAIIYVVRLAEDLSEVVSEPLEVVRASQPWELFDPQYPVPCNEGAFVLRHEGRYYLTYSSGHWASPRYAIGVATAPSPLGPWTKSPANPLLRTDHAQGISAPGHNSFTPSPDGTEWFIVYHARPVDDDAVNPQRMVFIDRVTIDPAGQVAIHGPTRTPQPLPSGAVRDSLPEHLRRRHEHYEAANRLRLTEQSLVRSLRARGPVVAGSGRPTRIEVPVHNHTDFDVTAEWAWEGPAPVNDMAMHWRIQPGEQTALGVAIEPLAADAPPPGFTWMLSGPDGPFAQGRHVLGTARTGSYLTDEGDWPDEPCLTLDAPWQVTIGADHWAGPADCSARAWVRVTEAGITVRVEVIDNQVWTEDESLYANDSVELYLDLRPPSQRGTGQYARGVFQAVFVPGLGFEPDRFAFTPVPDASVPGATSTSEVLPGRGYHMTIFLPAEGLVASHYAPEREFHLDVGINEAHGNGRKVQMLWSGGRDNWRDPRFFGRLAPGRPSAP